MAALASSYFQKEFEIHLQAEVILALRTTKLRLNRAREELRVFVSAMLQPDHPALSARRAPVMLRLSDTTVMNHNASFEMMDSLDALARARAKISAISAELNQLDITLKKEVSKLLNLHPDLQNPELAFLVEAS